MLRLTNNQCTFAAVSAGPSCRKEQFTEYYVEHSCRSRKPIKNAICSGTCSQDCCKPRRTKLRKVRLICNDGTSYTKEIEVIRKCQCTRRCYWHHFPHVWSILTIYRRVVQPYLCEESQTYQQLKLLLF